MSHFRSQPESRMAKHVSNIYELEFLAFSRVRTFWKGQPVASSQLRSPSVLPRSPFCPLGFSASPLQFLLL